MRIRSIHPEFWRSEDVAAMDWGTRLVFIGLWSYVDDNGVGRDVERLIIADLFPLEEDPRDTLARVSRALATLSSGGQITRYEVGGKPYLHLTSWKRWQRIDKPGKERYPLPTSENVTIRDTLATPSRETPDTLAPGEGEKGRRGEGEKTPSSAAADGAFDEFWSIAPRKVGKKDAQRKWAIAIKSADPAVIIEGMRRYAHGVTVTKTEQQFIVHPATWLHQGRWEDEDNVRPIRPAEPPSPWDTAPRYDANGRIS